MAKAPGTTTDTSVTALSAALAAPVVEKDEFADAFAGFTTEPAAAPPAKDPPTTAEKDAPETEEVETELEGAPEPAAEGAEGTGDPAKPAGDAPAKDAVAKPEGKPAADDPLTRLADMISQRQPQAQPQAQEKAPPAAPPAPLYSEAEVTQIQNFYKEWPEVAPAVEILLRGVTTSVTNSIFTEVARVMGPKLKLLDELANNFQYNQLKQTVPDWDDGLEDKISTWIKTLPPYLQAACTNVMETGTTDDISDLVRRFRQETGATSPNPGAQGGGQVHQAPAEKQATALSPAAKKAAAALAPVNSKRTGNTQVDPQSFDEAFEVFAKAG